MVRVIGIGDNVCDRYYPAMVMYPGGQAMNVAVFAKMLGADAAYLGVFGRDSMAEHVILTLDELGVDRSRCRQYDGENGYSKVHLEGGERRFIMSNRGGVAREHPLELDAQDLRYIGGFDVAHTSNNGHFDSQLGKVRSLGVPVSYDFSWRWRESYYREVVAPLADFAFFSGGDAPLDEVKVACEEFSSCGPRVVVGTLGGRGAVAYDGSRFYYQGARPAKAVDTLGAGDSFAAAFLVSYLTDGEIGPAMESGAEHAARTCEVHGAFGHGVRFEE